MIEWWWLFVEAAAFLALLVWLCDRAYGYGLRYALDFAEDARRMIKELL